MKRKILSLLLVFAMLFSVVSLTGCKTDDLEVAVNENAAKADTAVANAATKAAEELAAAKAALEEALASGDKANADKLTAAIKDLNAAIEAAKKAATDADDALNAEIEAAIEAAAKASADNLDAAKAALEAADASNATAINKATAELNAAIEAAKETAANADAALKTELEGKISSNLNKLAGQINTNLNNTKKSLQKLIEEGDAENADALAEAVAALNASIELAKTAAASADADLKAELNAAINAAAKSVSDAAAKNLKAAVEKLEAADKADADALAEAVKTLNAAIETVKTTANNANTGLKTELEKAIADATKAVADAAAANLKAAVEKLEAADKTDADALTEAVNNLNVAIEAAKTTATNADNTLKTELEKAIAKASDDVAAVAAANLEKAVKDLNKLIADGDSANIEALASTKTNLQNQIDAVKAICDTLTGSTAVADLETKLTAAIDAVAAAAMKLEAWDDTTDALITTILAELDVAYKVYVDRQATYTAAGFETIVDAYNDAKIRLMRAATIEQANTIVTNFVAEAEEVVSITDEIYNKLLEVYAKFEEIDAYIAEAGTIYGGDEGDGVEGKALLDDAKALIDVVTALITDVNNIVDPAIRAEVVADAENYVIDDTTTTNLFNDRIEAIADYDAYVAEYNRLEQIHGGKNIKNAMDALLADLITLDDETALADLRTRFDAWDAYGTNDVADVDGFADTYAKFVAAEARLADLKIADTEADAINSEILALEQSILLNGGTKTNRDALEALKAKVATWTSTYFADEYAVEKDPATVNYEMVDHDYLARVETKYNEIVADFLAAAQAFIDALNAVPTPVNILSGPAIQNMLAAYEVWVAESKLGNFDYDLTGGKTPADYVEILQQLEAEYDLIVMKALAAWTPAYAGIDGIVVDIYNTAEIEAMRAWYETYGVKDGGEFVFESGYILSDDVTVTKADYDAFVALETAQKALVDAKIAETQAVIDAIAAIGVVSTNKADAIADVRAAYEAWLAGTNVADIDGFTAADASRYAIDLMDATYEISNYATLVAAESTLADLINEINAIHALIAALDDKVSYTDFADDADRAAYEIALNDIDAAIATFIVNNNGDLEDNITAAETAKLEAGVLAMAKYDSVANMTAAYAAISVDAKFNAAAKAVLDAAAEDVDAVTAEADIADIEALAIYKINAINAQYVTYTAYVDALAADVVISVDDRALTEIKLGNTADRFLERVSTAGGNAYVDQFSTLFADELETAYPIAP